MREYLFRTARGLPLALAGAPVALGEIEHLTTTRAGLLGVMDFPGLRPIMQVHEGEQVRRGQPLWSDRKNPALIGVAPTSGTVEAIHRGQRRSLLSVSLAVDEGLEPMEFAPLADKGAAALRQRLIEAGLWASFRERPYDKVPAAESIPVAILVTAADNRPLSLDPAALIRRHEEAFAQGLEILSELTDGPIFVSCRRDEELPLAASERVICLRVDAPHPADLPGMLLHRFFPPTLERKVWHINWQDLIHIADLVRRGTLPSRRYLALGGGFTRPRLVSTLPGADLAEIAQRELPEGNWRVISGSPLYGHSAEEAAGFLGRYHLQACALREGGEPVFLNWMRPGLKQYSRMRVFAGGLFKQSPIPFSTLRNGSDRGLVPVEVYQNALPLEIPVVPLLKALLVGDTERAQEYGCLELGAEDLAVCTFVCPSKYDYGVALRAALELIEREG